MNPHDKLSGMIGILIGLAFCMASVSLGLGEVHQPGAGFLPFLVGAILLVLSALILIQALRRGRPEKVKPAAGMGKYWKGGLILLGLIFYTLALSFVGFTLTTFLFVVFLMKIVETQRWTRTIVTAFCSAVGFYLVFQSWLMLDLPMGPWGF